MNRQQIVLGLTLAILGGLLVQLDDFSRAQDFSAIPSRAPFSLEIPQLNRSGITSLEVRIATTQINTVKIHIAEPAADQIAYERIYTVVNAESANTIQTVKATSAGKVVTLDLERHERFRLQPGKNVVEISAIDGAKQEYYASFVINAGATQVVKSTRPVMSVGSSQFGGRRYALVVGVSRYKFHEGGLN